MQTQQPMTTVMNDQHLAMHVDISVDQFICGKLTTSISGQVIFLNRMGNTNSDHQRTSLQDIEVTSSKQTQYHSKYEILLNFPLTHFKVSLALLM